MTNTNYSPITAARSRRRHHAGLPGSLSSMLLRLFLFLLALMPFLVFQTTPEMLQSSDKFFLPSNAPPAAATTKSQHKKPLIKQTLVDTKKPKEAAVPPRDPPPISESATNTQPKKATPRQPPLEQRTMIAETAKTESTTTAMTDSSFPYVVGIMFANKERYLDSLQAQGETWLTDIPKHRVFAVGPESAAGRRPNLPNLIPLRCPDRELWCKRLQHIVEAYKLLQKGIDFEWLLSGNEDWYVNLNAMTEALQKDKSINPSQDAIVYSTLGCGQHWQYHKDSKNGTVPKPAWKREPQQCEEISKRGGICGGNGIVFSKRAIEVLMNDGGEEGLFKLAESLPFDFEKDHPQDDNLLSCVLYAFGASQIALKTNPWSSKPYQGVRKQIPAQRKTVGTVHAVTSIEKDMSAAAIIRDVHSMMTDARNGNNNDKSVINNSNVNGKEAGEPKKEATTIGRNIAQSNNDNNIYSASPYVAAIMFANKERYFDSLQAQAETWLADIPKSRVFAVGPESAAGKRPNLPRLVPLKCPDRELWCKRIQHITEAQKLLQNGISFEWLLSGNEDWYVNLPAMTQALQRDTTINPSQDAIVYANLGCGQHWEYHRDSKNGTLPKPPHWPKRQQCDEMSRKGGICGGSGIVFSKRAVEIMTRDGGEEGLFNLTKSLPFDWNSHPQDDNVLSCVIYAFGETQLRIKEIPWTSPPYQGVKRQNPSGRQKVGTVHAVTSIEKNMSAAAIIRDVHSLITEARSSQG